MGEIQMIHVLIVEDSRVMRETLERQISASQNYLVIASIENAANAEIACMRNKIDLVLMDICTADGESGLKAAAKIKKNYPQIYVVMMTSMPEHSFIQKAKASGCDSFWYKELDEITVLEVCDRTVNGVFFWPDQTPVVVIGNARSDEFTDRELDVIRGLAQGKRYEELGTELFMSTNTVKYHVKNILQKTGFHSTIQLVAEVVEKRLILPNY